MSRVINCIPTDTEFNCISILYVSISILYVCISILYVCISILYVCISILYVCISILYVCISILYVCISILYVCISILYVSISILYVCIWCAGCSLFCQSLEDSFVLGVGGGVGPVWRTPFHQQHLAGWIQMSLRHSLPVECLPVYVDCVFAYFLTVCSCSPKDSRNSCYRLS